MEKSYIKMNDLQNYLSLGNIFSLIKKFASNKETAMQKEIFCSLFNEKDINTTTVNNYCVGARAIGLLYKKKYFELKEQYQKNKMVMIPFIVAILNILDEHIYVISDDILNIINSNERFQLMTFKLKELAHNDEHLSPSFLNKLENSSFYEIFCECLFYAILDNPQPLYIQRINIIINKEELTEYLKIKLYEGVSYINSLKILASQSNMYAAAELASLEFSGLVEGIPNYEKAYELYLKAALKNHPKAAFMVAHLILTKKVIKDFTVFWKFLEKSVELDSAAGINTMGLCYKIGYNPQKEINLEKAKHYFLIASSKGYTFAYNNLGLICQDENEAIQYYKISADLGCSWALNKVGEYYRLNNELEKAFYYYQRSIMAPISERNKWGYFNLATYYYKNGFEKLKIKADLKKYNEYIKIFNKE